MKRNQKGFRFSDRKGNVISDTSITVVILIVMFIAVIVAGLAYSSINDMFQVDSDMSTQAKEISNNLNSGMAKTWDSLVILVACIFWMMTVISAFMIDSHPIFFIISIIGLSFILIAVAMLGNSYEELAADADLSTTIANYPMSNWIFSHFLGLVVAIGASIAFALFMKNKVMQW